MNGERNKGFESEGVIEEKEKKRAFLEAGRAREEGVSRFCIRSKKIITRGKEGSASPIRT